MDGTTFTSGGDDYVKNQSSQGCLALFSLSTFSLFSFPLGFQTSGRNLFFRLHGHWAVSLALGEEKPWLGLEAF